MKNCPDNICCFLSTYLVKEFGLYLLYHTWLKHTGIFLWYSLWRLGRVIDDKIYKNVGPSMTGSPWSSQICSHWASRNLLVTVQVLYLDIVAYRDFSSWVSALINCDSLCLPVCLSNLGGSDWSCNLTLFVVRIEWWLLNFFPTWLENVSLCNIFESLNNQ